MAFVKRRKLGVAAFSLLSPIKRLMGDADCAVHIAITRTALDILEQNGYDDACAWYAEEFDALQRGLVWADAGFKSASHFFFPYGERKGLRGQHHGLHLAEVYFHKARLLAKAGHKRIATFYLGAVLHLIQDATVPHHATLRLANRHRAFEQFVRANYALAACCQGAPVCFDELREFVQFNARIALKAHRLFFRIANEERRFFRTMHCVIPVAQRTSAGALAWFYQTLLAEP